ncbi:MAG: PKD domain-containing protein [Ferruginibacter sp.]
MKIILFLTFFVHIFFFSFCKNFSEINSFPNEGAFSNFASRYDSILPPPDTISYTGPTTFCEGGSIKLTAPTGASYKWQLNGANINGATSATYTVNAVIQSGTYTVIVNSDTSNPITITVNPNPTPAFSFSPDNQCSNIPIQFSNTSIGASSYTWDFGDSNSSDNSSNEINPSHQFIGVPGNGTQTFNIKLTEENDSGCSANISKTITTKQISSTVLAGTGETTYNGSTYFSSCALTDTTLTFVNQSSTINTNYQIQWGDATPNFNATAFLTTTHTYSIGTYAINYIVTNQNGCIDTTIYRVFVGGNPAVGFGNPGSTGICTGSSLTFPISNTASNSSGTIYTVTFNDGSDPIIFKHPPPATVTHTFAVTSCGTNSPPYPNSFSASIQASNPCQSSSATVVPIYVSQKPVAAFSISPNDTVCINSSVVFNNTNPFNDNNINGTCSPGESVWQITPATGWTLKNGSLGNDLNLINPVFWISGSTIIGISFDQIGTFTVKLKTGNSTCGSDSITKTICVNQLPVANFSIDKNIGCAPLIVSTTNNPSPTTCGNNTYNWSVSYSSTTGCSPDTSDYTFTNGTDTNSVNPRFQFKNPGTYTIKLIATSPSGSCFSQPFTQTVTVKGKPNPVLTAPTSICVNQSINPSATASCYTNSATYAWMFGGGTPSSSNIQAPGTINYTTPGTYNISLDVINECGVTNITDSIHVINVTTSNAGPPQKVCGSSVTMAADTTTNGTGLWSRISGPSSYAITTASSPTTTITNLVQGTYVFQWKITNGICSSSSNDTITILSGPTPANAGSDQELCLATIVSLSANPPSIGTGLWSLVRGPADYTITNASSPSTTVTALVPGVYTFQWKTSLNTCTSSMDSVLITIDSSAIKANAGSDQTICSSTVTLSANSPGTQKGTWSLISGPNVPTITNISLSNTSVTGLTAGAYLFQWKISSGVCNASYDTVQINVTATATVADAGQDQSLCAVDSISLTGNKALTGSGKWTVISGPNSPTIADSSLQTSKVTELIHGAYIFRWTITNGNCPATSDSVAITIYDNATISHAGLYKIYAVRQQQWLPIKQ